MYWFVAYVLKKEFLDGRAGWTFNRMKRRYFDEIRLKILEMKGGEEKKVSDNA